MANSIRNILTLYGTRREVDRFVGGFLGDGLGASMAIPSEANPNTNTAKHGVRALKAAMLRYSQTRPLSRDRSKIASVLTLGHSKPTG